MRIGTNPVKSSYSVTLENYHRIVIPVYIPNFEGYFKESFDIFKMCLGSLLLTVHEKTRITIYDNNCHPIVGNYIDEQYKKHDLIDQVFHSKVNLGKINAILAGVKGNIEPLITITDADVLFKSDWQKEVEKLFISFPEAGMISPVPASKVFGKFTANNWGKYFFSGKIQFSDVLDPEGLELFDKSLGNKKGIYSDIHLKKYLTVKAKDGTKACMGCGHFVATMRRDVFDKGSRFPAFIKIDGGVENKFIDIPNERLRFLRLATLSNHAFHMGNGKEKWMDEEFSLLAEKSQDPLKFVLEIPKTRSVTRFQHLLGRLILRFVNNQNGGRKLILKLLGMNEEY